MKNMKKTIVGVAILAIALIVMMGSVNAASITTNPNGEVKKGETVTVTLGMNATSSIGFELSYNKDIFEFLGGSAGNLGNIGTTGNTNGTVNVQLFATDGTSKTETVTLNFKAKETTTDAKAFTVKDFTTESYEAMPTPTTTIKVVDTASKDEGKKDPTPSGDKQETNKPQETNPEKKTTTDTKKGEEKVGTNGKVLTKLPQTGTPVYIGMVAVMVIAGVVLVTRKTK